MKNKIIIFLVLASFSGFGQITRTLPNVTNTADSMKPVSVAQKVALDAKLSTTTAASTYVPKVGNATLTNRLLFQAATPTFTEYQRTDIAGTARVSVGMLGAPEANLSFNMDYTTGIHKYYDSTKEAMWLALSGGNFALQYAPSGSAAADNWTGTGSQYLFWGDNTGKFAINTNLADDKGTAQLFIKRTGGNGSIGGYGDLVIEGDRRISVSAPIYINNYNVGNIYANKGGGNFGVGTYDVPNKFNVVSAGADGQGLYRDADATSGTAGVYSYMGAKIGTTLTPSSSFLSFLQIGGSTGTLHLQTRTAGVLSTKMFIGSDGSIGVGTTTPTSKLQVVGLVVYADNATAIAAGLTAGAFYRTSTGVLMVAF